MLHASGNSKFDPVILCIWCALLLVVAVSSLMF